MPATRKTHSPLLKAKVALEAIKGDRTVTEIAQIYRVHPNMVTKRKPTKPRQDEHSRACRLQLPAVACARARARAESPLGEICAEEGRVDPADEVDHRVPLKDRPDLAFARSNLQSICFAHHRERSARERRGHSE